MRSAHHTYCLGPPSRCAIMASTSAPRAGTTTGELRQRSEERIGIGDSQARRQEAAVGEPRSTQRRQHRVVDVLVVQGVHGVQRDPQQRCLDHRTVGERPVERGGIEVCNAVPQRKIGRRRFLRLQRQDTPNGVADNERRTAQEQLAVEGRPVDPSCAETHSRLHLPRGRRAPRRYRPERSRVTRLGRRSSICGSSRSTSRRCFRSAWAWWVRSPAITTSRPRTRATKFRPGTRSQGCRCGS